MEFISPINDYSLSERVYRLVVEKLQSSEIHPGAKVTEVEIAAELGISRGPIREAFKRLASDGFLELIPHRGCFVPHVDAKEVYEFFDIRKRLESLALSLAFKYLSMETLLAFRETFLSCYDYPTVEMITEFLEMDATFHETIIRESRSKNLQAILDKLRQRIMVFRYMGTGYSERINAARIEHLAIVDSLISGDLTKAIEHLENHIDNAKRFFGDCSKILEPIPKPQVLG